MKRWRLIGGVALVFVLGVLVGSLGFHYYDRHRSERFWKDPAERRTFFLNKLTRRLSLTEEQQGKVKVIIGEMDRRIQAMMEENRLRKVIDDSFARMKEILDPDQRRKLDELRARHEQRMQGKKKRPHFP